MNLVGVGLLIGLFGLGGVFAMLLAGRMTRRLAEGARVLIGGALASAGFLLLAPAADLAVATAALLVLGFGFFTLHNVLQVRATRMAPDARGAAMSLFAAAFFLAQALGAMIGGWLFDRVGGEPLCFLSAVLLAVLALTAERLLCGPSSGNRCAQDTAPASSEGSTRA